MRAFFRLAVLISLAVPCATAPAFNPFGSVHPGGAIQPVYAADATPTSHIHDLGSPFAGTEHLVGHSIPWNWTDHVPEKLTPEVCDAFDAVIDRHTYWFNEASNSQQMEERAFLANVTTTLCASPEQSDEEYTTILHGMLQSTRDAINRHVHSAFLVKSYCGMVTGQIYDSRSLNNYYQNHFTGGKDCAPEKMVYGPNYDKIDSRAALGHTCLEVVAAHEKYNLAEGFYFLNMSMHLLERGAAFCQDPDVGETLATMATQLEARMSYHSSNHAFAELADSFWKQACDTSTEVIAANFARRSSDLYEDTLRKMDDAVSLETKAECTYPNTSFTLMSYVHHNPPDALDAITIFEGNTQLALAASAEAVRTALTQDRSKNLEVQGYGGCLDEAGQPDQPASDRISAKLEATGLPQAIYDAMGSTSTGASARPHYLIIPSVYHKLAAMCYPKDTNEAPGTPPAVWSPVYDESNMVQVNMCQASSGDVYQDCTILASSTDSNPILDIVTSADITQCSGEACKAGARAIVAYHQLLGDLTSMRWDAVQVAVGNAPASPLLDQGAWVFQDSCIALENIVDRAAKVQESLPSVLAGLRQSAAQLEVSCVAPKRDVGDVAPDFFAGPVGPIDA